MDPLFYSVGTYQPECVSLVVIDFGAGVQMMGSDLDLMWFKSICIVYMSIRLTISCLKVMECGADVHVMGSDLDLMRFKSICILYNSISLTVWKSLDVVQIFM